MRTLPNGCWCSELNVFPNNWDKAGASIKNSWRIEYYFHDPAYQDDPKLKYGKLVIVKRMNSRKFKTLEERRVITKILLKEIRKMLEENGYNPITKKFAAELTNGDIEPTTNFIRACEMAKDKLKCSATTKLNIKSCLKFIEKSAINLNLHGLQISQVRRKHISNILNNCSRAKEYWSPHLYNHYRTYLMMVFKKLVELEAVESNPVDEHLPKELVETPVRKTLSEDQVTRILEHFANDQNYLRFIHIFFHSGARPVELLRLKYSDVDLQAGIFKLKNRKGNKLREQEKPIKKVALQYWAALMEEVKPGDYLFGGHRPNFLAPGIKPATRDYVTKKWNREVKDDKKGLGIKVDLYSLKHKNLDEIAAYLSIKEAQKAAGHESPVITMVYATGEAKRQNERYASVPNVLGG